MPAKYSIKRNTLSSKWGVWANGTEASSTVEKLLVELRSSEDAEAYCARLEAGESHEAIVASFSAKKPKKEGGGIFGRFRKRSTNVGGEPAVAGAVSNPVIEIETADKKLEALELSKAEAETQQPVKAPEAPSRFQVIEQPKPKPVPVVEPEPVAEVELVAEVEVEPLAQVEPEPVVEPVSKQEQVAEAEPVASPEPVEPVKAISKTAPVMPEPLADSAEGERVKMVSSPSSLSDKVKAAFKRKESAQEIDIADIPDSPEEGEQAVDQQEPDLSMAEVSEKVQEPATEPVPAPVTEVKASADTISEADFEPTEKPEPEQPVVLEVQQPQPEPAPLVEPKAEREPEPAAPVNGRGDSALVDWTFTPPPDVTPAELKASGMKVPESPAPVEPAVAEPTVAQEVPAASPAPKVTPTQKAKVDPELAQPAPKKQSEPVSDKADGKSRMTVEIGISKALKEVTIGDPRVPDKKYNKVASQEYTEVSKAFSVGNSPEKLHEELIHLAAVCLAWADAIEKRKAGDNESKAA